ncbi:MAG: hypothetical protein ABSF70_03025 [Terracidiphilus sp.]|jgi:hypothetical protein
MLIRRLLVHFGMVLAVTCGLSGAPAMAVTPFAITATNLTMPSSGNGSSQYTITGIPAAGTITIGCLYSGPITAARIPTCTYGPIDTFPVPTGEQIGTVLFYPFGAAVPMSLYKAPHRSNPLPATGLALAGALMLGFGFRRSARRWLVLTVFAAISLTVMGGFSGCSIDKSMTPGTYQYTITASYVDTANAVGDAILTTNIQVTVP